jgi:transcriptional regulator with XRE-family HTH domain
MGGKRLSSDDRLSNTGVSNNDASESLQRSSESCTDSRVLATRTEPFYAALGRRISDARERRGLSQAKLGEMLKPPVTRASIANVESGKQRVLAHTLVDLAAALGISVADLIPDALPQAERPSKAEVATALLKENIPESVANELARAFGHTPSPPRKKR